MHVTWPYLPLLTHVCYVVNMSGIYTVYYTGIAGSGYAVFIMKEGVIAGAEATGGVLDGVYKQVDDGKIEFSLTLSAPVGAMLVTGPTVENNSFSQHISAVLPENFSNGKTIAIQNTDWSSQCDIQAPTRYSMTDWGLLITTAAIILGPIIAVLVTRFIDYIRAEKERKYDIFRTLMRTRETPLNWDHVGALNLIEVEFRKHPAVIDAWNAYLEHLGTELPPVEQKQLHDEGL